MKCHFADCHCTSCRECCQSKFQHNQFLKSKIVQYVLNFQDSSYLILLNNLTHLKMSCWLKSFLAISVLLNFAEVSTGQECRTDNEGPQKNTPCVFPFTHSGKTYIMCTNNRDPDGKLWCWCSKTFFFLINGQNSRRECLL